MRISRVIGSSFAAALLAGCLTTGGGGGGDCRDADDGCSPGFACVAVAGGTAYACRAACDGPEDCLRDEVCGPGAICIDRPPVQAEDDAIVVSPPVTDQGPRDAEPVRLIDAGPEPDSGVVMVDPDVCAVDRAPARRLVVSTELTGFEGFPLYFAVTAEVERRFVGLTFEPLTTADRAPTGEVTAAPVFELGPEGEFRVPTVELWVPRSANQLGGELLLRVAFEGAVRSDGSICGALAGALVEPPVGDVSGSPFAGRPSDDGRGDPWGACDGCLP